MRSNRLNPLVYVDSLLDRLTSYQLMLYFLYTLAGWALYMAFLSRLPFRWPDVLLSGLWLLAVCRLVNLATSRFMDIPANKDSDLISGLILFLILSPANNLHGFLILAFAATIAMLSKYAFGLSRSHVFNPAALGAFAAGAIFHTYASWWVGTSVLTPVVFIGGLLIMRKMKRYILVALFMGIYLLHTALTTKYGSEVHVLWLSLTSTPVMFFAYVMLIEPLTSPVHWYKYLPYSTLVAVLYSFPKFHLSPEQGLLIGNAFSYIISPVRRFKLTFVEKVRETHDVYSFLFKAQKPLRFTAGQYMEWTLPKSHSDSRGNRRYLTISSSPSEPDVMVSLRYPEKPSAFKTNLDEFKKGDSILASQLAGQFILPKDKTRKVVLIAGGIGVTPFRSMVKQLIDSGEHRPMTLLYSGGTPQEFAFTKLFQQASSVGLKTVYTVTSKTPIPEWHGHTGHLDKQFIKDAIPDYKQQLFYVSGPFGFVSALRQNLTELGISRKQIISDYFPGYG